MLIIPLSPVPNQQINVSLATQPCLLNIYYQPLYGTFLDLTVNGTLIMGGILCLNAVKLIRSSYLGFIGDLAFFDTQGVVYNNTTQIVYSDPVYTGFGPNDTARFVLAYLETSDLS